MQGCGVKNTLILSSGVGGVGGVMPIFGDPYREYEIQTILTKCSSIVKILTKCYSILKILTKCYSKYKYYLNVKVHISIT